MMSSRRCLSNVELLGSTKTTKSTTLFFMLAALGLPLPTTLPLHIRMLIHLTGQSLLRQAQLVLKGTQLRAQLGLQVSKAAQEPLANRAARELLVKLVRLATREELGLQGLLVNKGLRAPLAQLVSKVLRENRVARGQLANRVARELLAKLVLRESKAVQAQRENKAALVPPGKLVQLG
jgi:hypothetical protein